MKTILCILGVILILVFGFSIGEPKANLEGQPAIEAYVHK